ncbi:YegP family protein [Paracoccus shanxieyensis]|uniref:DUF1508 domain-containing protein n=1 Tax=Paracoccus shanxieyensis TaxID=2675752 RepID=A0A6L6J0A2_9RHOB|nr:YegP family protein [Paracoccus shanxieyensis]MTH65599.1 DUF1508 domain-containing protein [Paracoccus shanxieyensis]MTH88826.1 DUF1508 domain-containing protein [Paracoccus shanxieyensis]
MYEIYYTMGKGYWWRLKATNGEILCHSEMFTAKQSAQSGIAAVKRIAHDALVYDRT